MTPLEGQLPAGSSCRATRRPAGNRVAPMRCPLLRYLLPVSVAVTGWMNSPGHRANILRPQFLGAGMGCAVSASGKVYYCQDFLFVVAGWPGLSHNADLWATAPASDTVPPAGWASAATGPR